MIIKTIFIASLICLALSEKDIYLPMDHDSKYGEDVCGYIDEGHRYVKPCKKGQYCVDVGDLSDTSMLEICQDIPKVVALYNPNEGKCTTSFECEGDLNCLGGKCEKECPENQFSYGYYENYNCESDTLKGTGFCESTTISTTDSSVTTKYSYPDIYKRCGKLTILEDPRTGFSGRYYIQLNEYDYIGTVEDGGYVNDEQLCESGFALYFYYDGKSENPNPSRSNAMYLRCVTPLSISKINTHTCTISYKIKDGDILNYNIDQSSYYSSPYDICDEDFIKIKSEMFRKYSQTIKEDERKTCGELDGINKYTCENNELIKLWFFYKYPEEYIVYNDREKLSKVLDYKIQKKYPNYSFSKYLNIKFLMLLYLLFF